SCINCCCCSCAKNRSTQLKGRRDGRKCAVRVARFRSNASAHCEGRTKKSCAYTGTAVIPSREDGEESPSHVRRSSCSATEMTRDDLIMCAYRDWCHSEPRRRRGIPFACATLVVLGGAE